MAKKFLSTLKIVNLPSDPISGSEGELYFDTSASVAKIYQAGAWSVLGAGGGGGGTTVSTTEPESPEIGDSWYKNDTGEFYVYDGTYWVEINGVIEGESNLYTLSDVTLTSPTNNEILAYDSSSSIWINQTASEAGIATTSDLSNYLTISSASTNYVTKTYADNAASSASAAAVSYLVDSAPSTLDTLNELAAALGDDANFASTVTTALGNKLDSSTASSTYLTQLSASTTYQPIGSYSLSSHNHTLDGLSNVDINSLTDGDAIIWSSASSAWINQVASGGAGIIVSTTAPEDPETGTGWYNNETGVLAVWDGTYWVDVNGVISLTQEQIQDYVAPLLDHSNHNNISATYDDISNQIILSASASGGTGTGVTISETAPEDPQIGDGWYNNASGAFYLYDGNYWVEVNGIVTITEEQIQDYASSLFIHNNHTNVTATYDDANGEIILNTSASITNIDSISSPDFIQFDTTANVTPVTGLLGWDSVEGTLNLGISSTKHIHVGEESVYRVRNSTGSTISKGTALYASGVQSSGRIDVSKYVADGSVREVRFMGLATENISNGVNGFVQHFGYVRDLDTRGTASTAISVGDENWSAGDILYVHPTVPGKLTNIKPTHAIVVAIIIIRHQTTGILFVRPSSGGHLEDIHDILISASVQNNDLLMYESSSELWKNKPISDIINDSINPFLLMGG